MRPESDEPTWYRLCESGGCVEIAVQGESINIRSSKAPETMLSLTRAEWRDFLAGAKEGSLDNL